MTAEEVEEATRRGVRVLSRRHLEAYLMDDEILHKLCEKAGKADCAEDLKAKASQRRMDFAALGSPEDDYKKAAGEIYNDTKALLRGSGLIFGSNAKAFCRDILAPLVTPDTKAYQKLKREVLD